MSATEPKRFTLRYDVVSRDDWALSEEQMPESKPHERTTALIYEQLEHWVRRTGRDAEVGRNLAVRWDERRPQVGIDPDVCLVEPAPPEGPEVDSVCTWLPGVSAPRIAFEVVSSKPRKDYASAPERYAASGTSELVVFDGMLRGPAVFGGPVRIQVWRRSPDGAFERVDAGEGPFFLASLGAWAFAVDEGRRLRIADDRGGTRWWPTAAEDERAAKEKALARVAELEAELRKR